MPYITITGAQYQALRDALVAAFPNPYDMVQMLQFRLDKALFAIVPMGDLNTMYFKLIGVAQAEGWLDRLILAALAARPGQPALHALAQELGLTALEQPEGEGADSALQRIIDKTRSFLDIATWREKLGQIEGQVCRVEVPKHNGKTAYGTGFLLGADVVITNYHVMKSVLDGNADADKVRLRFDYKVVVENAAETVINNGTVFHLADAWNIYTSPYSEVDKKSDPKPHPPAPNELDFVLMRVKDKPGEQPVGGSKAEPGAPTRGWIILPAPPPALTKDQPIFIVQHPDKKPMKLALATDGVIQVNDNSTRVRYSTNTLGGSSGSPCFDAGWNLVALHHAGDPNFSDFHKPEYNQGIPMTAILALLEQEGKRDTLP